MFIVSIIKNPLFLFIIILFNKFISECYLQTLDTGYISRKHLVPLIFCEPTS